MALKPLLLGALFVLNKCAAINRFYRSSAWLLARQQKIAACNGRCEKCGAIGEEVHHKIALTPSNITDTNITLNPDNLIYLCKECHNKEHDRFKKKASQFDSEGNLKPF